MRLVRDNDVAAELVGVNLPRTRTLAFVVAAAFAGLGGSLYVLINATVTPSTFPLTLSITLLTLMVLGGIGTLSGAVIGGIIYAFSSNLVGHINSLTGINPASNLGANMQGIIFGVLLILTMLFAPRGIAGLGPRIRRFLARRPRIALVPTEE
jgi:branched-chain amino acid transport system permease protein